MYCILFVLNDPNKLDPLLESWSEAGIQGATILESTGLFRMKKVHIPMRYIFGEADAYEGHYTLFALVEDMEAVQTCLQACEKVVGDLSTPNSGVFTTWPLTMVKGLPKPSIGEA
jgi:hypothetical protein